jgi:hypothetical protein
VIELVATVGFPFGGLLTSSVSLKVPYKSCIPGAKHFPQNPTPTHTKTQHTRVNKHIPKSQTYIPATETTVFWQFVNQKLTK